MIVRRRNRFVNFFLFLIALVILLLAALLIAPSLLFAATQYDHKTYWMTTAEQASVSWDPAINAEWYELQCHNLERDAYTALAKIPSPSTSFTLKFPRAGHYIVEVRSCKVKTFTGGVSTDGGFCTEWSKSDMPERTSSAGTFWIYVVIPAPTQMTFE